MIGTMLCILVAVIGAYEMVGKIRAVDIMTLIFGGFGAGAGIVKMVLDYRKMKKDTNSIAH
jgi:hypothetical protein